MNIVEKHNFRLIIFGNITSRIGDEVNKVAFSVWAATVTGSASTVAIVYSMQTFARFFFSIFIGKFIDNSSKKQIMIVSDLSRGVLTIINAAIILYAPIEYKIVLLSTVAFFLGFFESMFSPSLNSLIPQIFQKDNIKRVNANKFTFTSLSRITGLLFASVIVSFLGFFYSYVINALTFTMSGIAEFFIINGMKDKAKRKNKTFRLFFSKNAISYLISHFKGSYSIIENNSIKSIIVLAAGINFFLAPLTNIVVLFRLKSFDYILNDFIFINRASTALTSSYSILFLCIAIGNVIGAQLAKKIKLSLFNAIVFMNLSLTPVLIVDYVDSFRNNVSILMSMYILFGFIFGFSLSIFNVNYSTLIHTRIDKDIMGSFWGFNNSIIQLCIPLGMFFMSFFQDNTYTSHHTLLITFMGIFLITSLAFLVEPNRKSILFTS